jgi:hypothetical protein
VSRRPAFEPLEDRRLCSVSPAAPESLSVGRSHDAGLLLPAVHVAQKVSPAQVAQKVSPGHLPGGQAGTNIIAILIGL